MLRDGHVAERIVPLQSGSGEGHDALAASFFFALAESFRASCSVLTFRMPTMEEVLSQAELGTPRATPPAAKKART